MIERLMSLNHFTYKKPFSGSDKGNRFKYIIQMIIEEVPAEEPELFDNEKKKEIEESGEVKEPKKIKLFKVTCWNGEFNSTVTKEEEKQVRKFDFTEEGYEEALKWLNEESNKIQV